MEAYEKLKALVAAVDEDMRKAEGGNKAAGTRVRQSMQEIKKAAQDVREAVLSIREGASGAGGAGSSGGAGKPAGH